MGIGYNTSIVRGGLVLHLDAANVKSYPGSGTTWNDVSGNANHGTLINGPSYNSGESFSFDGTNDGANFGDVVFGSVFSISIWLKGDPTQTSSYCGLSGKAGIGNFGAGGLYGNAANSYVRFGFVDTVGGQREVSNSGYTDLLSTSWVNYIGTYDQTNLKLYRNSVEIAIGAYSQTPVSTNDPYGLGHRPTSGAYYFKGSISNSMVYSRALSASEVKQNFEALRGRYGI